MNVDVDVDVDMNVEGRLHIARLLSAVDGDICDTNIVCNDGHNIKDSSMSADHVIRWIHVACECLSDVGHMIDVDGGGGYSGSVDVDAICLA